MDGFFIELDPRDVEILGGLHKRPSAVAQLAVRLGIPLESKDICCRLATLEQEGLVSEIDYRGDGNIKIYQITATGRSTLVYALTVSASRT